MLITTIASICSSSKCSNPATPEFFTPPADDDDQLDVAHGDTPVRCRKIENLIGEEPVPGLAPRNLDFEIHLANTGKPCSFAEAEHDQAWQATMREEIEAMEKNNTWELVYLPQGHRPMGL